ncbi:uncharacterized protein STEHIDRAFT_135458 [Stereum hirsutum FP-91666 SS1]|uniref:Pali-domain-containing protein n=1 Tax=Stereum hirsutum (strain FP-91666) TaxID=721885 RepID=R7RXT7_STEHR|nr:uncharacterized protein STEHIDRAFT_135458 [Stereum hirsutum FP-91666 SS1]EIM80149.1 hypothetical protein STEHIDRAFT_135458 [Stereum hirsutum FP-91666 SS1]
MSARAFCIPGVVLLFCAFVLSLIVAISLPALPALDITRTHFSSGSLAAGNSSGEIGQLRVLRAYCIYDSSSGDRTCIDQGHGYAVTVSGNSSITIGSSWTRGLAVHPVATIVTFIAFLLSLSSHITVMLLSSIASGLAALLTLIAFAIDIALFVYVKHKMADLDVEEHTITGPGFWITFATFLLLLIASCTVCFGRRKERMAGATAYPSKPGVLNKLAFWRR